MILLRPYGPSPDQVAQGAQEMAMEEKLELYHGILKCIMGYPLIFMHFLEHGALAAENWQRIVSIHSVQAAAFNRSNSKL